MILSPLKRSAGQSIFQAARPRLVITNIPFWNKSQVRLNFGSKWFVNQLGRFKFSISANKVMSLKQSTIEDSNKKNNMKVPFQQWVADNVDHKISKQ